MLKPPTIPTLAILLCIAALAPTGSAAAPDVEWLSSLGDAWEFSEQEQRPLLIFFHADWCGYCKRMMRETFADAAVREALRPFVPVQIDVDGEPEAQEVAQQFAVGALPHTIVLKPGGGILTEIRGYAAPGPFRDLLAEVGKLYVVELPQPERQREALVWLSQKRVKASRWEAILATVADRRGDPKIQDAIKGREDLPLPLLVESLAHKNLASRLAAFEVLLDLAGEDFGFDPWRATGTQDEALGRWQEWAKQVGESGLPKKQFVALTRDRIKALVGDLLAADDARRRRARIQLSQSGKPGLEAIRKIAAGLADLKTPDRLRIKEVLYSILVPRQLTHNRLGLAHALVYGSIESRTDTIEKLREGGGVNALELLGEVLHDRNPLMREAAIEAIRRIGGRAAKKLLLSMKDEKDLNVRVTLVAGLGRFSYDDEVADVICGCLSGPEEQILAGLKTLKSAGSSGLSVSARTKAKAALKPLFKDPRWRVRAAALETAMALSLKGLKAEIINAIEDEDEFVRKKAILACGKAKLKKARERLRELFKTDHALKPTIIRVLPSIDPEGLGAEIAAELVKAPDEIIAASLTALASRSALTTEVAEPLLRSERQSVKLAAIAAVRDMGDGHGTSGLGADVLSRVIELMGPGQPAGVRSAARRALMRFDWDSYLRDARRLRTELARHVRSGARGFINRVFSWGGPHAGDKKKKLELAKRTALRSTLIRQARPLLDDPDPTVQYEAAVVLARVDAMNGVRAIRARLQRGPTTVEEKVEIIESLCRALRPSARLVESDGTSEAKTEARKKTLQALAESTLDGLFECEDARVLKELSRQAAWLNRPKLTQQVLALVKEERLDAGDVLSLTAHRPAHVSAMASMMKSEAVQAPFHAKFLELARAGIDGSSERLRHLSLILLGRLGEEEDVKTVQRFLDAKDKYVRRSALIALYRLKPKRGSAQAAKMLADPFADTVLTALNILGAKPDRPVSLHDRFKAGENYWYRDRRNLRRSSARPAEDEGDDLFADKRPRRSGRPKKAVVAAVTELMKHRRPKVCVAAGMFLLGYRIKTDYTPLVRALEADADRDLRHDRVREVLLEKWARVPAEFYHYLKREYGHSRDTRGLKLIKRVDQREIELITEIEKQEHAELLLRAEEVALPDPPRRRAPSEAGPSRYSIVYFYQRGCRHCQKVGGYLDQLQKQFARLEIRKYNILSTDSAMLNEILCHRAGIAANRRQVVPSVFSASQGVVGDDIGMADLLRVALSSEDLLPPWELEEAANASGFATASDRIKQRHASKGVVWVVGAGLIDGVNPCAFTVIIFFLSYLAYVGRSKQELLLTGVMFTLGVFATYLLIGFGLLEAVQALKFMPAVSNGVYWATAIFALVVGLVSFRDGVLCLKGRARDVALQLPDVIKKMIHAVIRRQTQLRAIVLTSLVTGFLVSLLELACTGQVYLPAIVFISKGQVLGSVLLVAYNVAFVTPLVVIFILAYFGLTSQMLSRFFQRHVAALKFSLAGLFFGLCGLLVVLG